MTVIEPHQQLILDRAYANMHASGTWPSQEQLQRELASEHQDVLVRDVVMQMPALASIASPADRVRLTLRGLASVPAAKPLLDAYLRALRSIIARYRDLQVEAQYSADDVRQLGLDPTIERELLQLLRDDAWPFGSGGGEDDAWTYEISPAVLAASNVQTVAELVRLRFGSAEDDGDDEVGPQAEPLKSTPGAAPAVDPDRPIASATEDLFGRARLARALATQAAAELGGQGFVIGISGPWGSGKTSVMNLMAEAVESAEAGYVVRFDPWLFSSSEELVLRFLSELSSQLRHESGLGDLANRIGEYAQILAPLSALVAAPWLGPVIAVSGRLAARRHEKPPASAQKQRDKVCQGLRELDRRVIVLIDDVDRLQGTEVRDVVRLVKLVGDFPNTTYVLAYDQARVARALDEVEQEGQAFLEKIVQLSYEVPGIDPTQLARALGASISTAVGDLSRYHFSQEHYTNLFADARALFATLRDVRRYTNVLPSTLSLVGDEVELTDVLALEALRIRVPDAFARIVAAKDALTTARDGGLGWSQADEERAKSQVEAIVGAADPFSDQVGAMITRLFPAAGRHLGRSSYGGEWLARWRRERRVAHPEVLDIYLQKALPPGVLPATLVEGALANFGDPQALSALLDGLSDHDLESLLGRLEHYEEDFPTECAERTIAAFFNVQDRLQRPKRHVFDLGADFAVPRIVLRVLRKLDQGEVARVVRVALPEIATLSDRGDLVRMVGYREDAGHKLVSETDAGELQSAFFDELLAADGARLRPERDLLRLLFWARGEREAAVQERVEQLVGDDDFLLGLLRAALGETVGSSVGDAAVRRSQQLNWAALTELVSHTVLADRVRQLHTPEVQEGLDERTKLALEQARRFADGPAPGRDQPGAQPDDPSN
jgi:predicted KAP-like P-loop ATPase